MRKTFSFVLCCFVLNLISVNADADEVKTTVVRISETRAKTLVKKKNFFGDFTTLQLTVKLKGSDVAKATKYGKIKIDKAVDNLGNSLIKSNRFDFGRDRLQPLDRNRDGFSNEKPPEDETNITLNMDASGRNATTIAVLEGSLTLFVTTTENITFTVDELKKLVGKKVQNATLKKIGVNVKIISFQVKPTDSIGKFVELDVTGKAKLVSDDVRIVDAKNKRFDFAPSFWWDTQQLRIKLFGRGSVPKGAKLIIPVESFMKVVVVKFRFTDIPLP